MNGIESNAQRVTSTRDFVLGERTAYTKTELSVCGTLNREGIMGRKILVADDDPICRHAVVDCLTMWGHEVIAVEDGLQAWSELQKENSPELAILDWIMPRMNGIQLLQQLRTHHREPYTYVLLLTAKTDTKDLLQGLGAGADDYLMKPFDVQELEARLRVGKRIIDREQRTRSAAFEQLEAMHDPLTGIYNRTAIVDALRRELARAGRDDAHITVIMADLDDRMASDLRGYGAAVTATTLHEIAVRIKTTMRAYDSLGCYDERHFLLVVPKCRGRDASHVAERVRIALTTEPLLVGKHRIRASLALGTVCAHKNADIDSVLRAAEAALRTAKASVSPEPSP